jgi:hypothetical protein
MNPPAFHTRHRFHYTMLIRAANRFVGWTVPGEDSPATTFADEEQNRDLLQHFGASLFDATRYCSATSTGIAPLRQPMRCDLLEGHTGAHNSAGRRW